MKTTHRITRFGPPGDWNGDGGDTSDMVFAFQTGSYTAQSPVVYLAPGQAN
ncbi:MAG: hypothetical protein R3C28_11700 [Pirellulaceae bacterium]